MRWILRLLVAAALLSLPFVLGQLPPVRAALTAALEVMRGGGVAGVVAFLGAYTAGCLVTAPIWIFNGMAGYAFGPVRGALLASVGNALGMTVAFLLGRFVLSRPLGRWLGQNPKWAAVHRAVEGDAWRIGLLLRLSPLAPQNLLSYGFSLTPMRLRTFVLATWIGLFPIICLQAYLGSLLHDVADLLEGRRPPLGPWGWVATGVSLVVTVTAVTAVARIGHRALKQAGVLGAEAAARQSSPQ